MGEKINTKKLVLLARNEFNSIEEKIFKAQTDAETSHNKFTLVGNEGKKTRRHKDSIRTKESEQIGLERDRIIEQGKHIRTDKILKRNERKNLKLKTET